MSRPSGVRASSSIGGHGTKPTGREVEGDAVCQHHLDQACQHQWPHTVDMGEKLHGMAERGLQHEPAAGEQAI